MLPGARLSSTLSVVSEPPDNGRAVSGNGNAASGGLPRAPASSARGSTRHRGRKALLDRGIRFRLHRGRRPRRGQLGLQEPQRDVGCLQGPLHQRLARADGLRGLSDADVVSRLPAPHAHRRLLRTATSITSGCASTSRSRPPSRAPQAARTGACGRFAPTTGRRVSTTRCSSPTATTGTRAGPNRPSPARTRSRASRCTPTPTWTTRSSRARTSSSSAWATRRWTSRSSPFNVPPATPTSPTARRPSPDHPQVRVRQAGRSDSATRADTAYKDPLPLIHQAMQRRRPAPRRATACRRPTTSCSRRTRRSPAGRILGSHRPRHDRPEAEHRLARGRQRPLRRRQRGPRRRRRLLHRLQDHLPVLRRGPPSPPPDLARSGLFQKVRLPPATSRGSTSSASSSRWGRSCRSPRPKAPGSSTTSPPPPPPPPHPLPTHQPPPTHKKNTLPHPGHPATKN